VIEFSASISSTGVALAFCFFAFELVTESSVVSEISSSSKIDFLPFLPLLLVPFLFAVVSCTSELVLVVIGVLSSSTAEVAISCSFSLSFRLFGSVEIPVLASYSSKSKGMR